MKILITTGETGIVTSTKSSAVLHVLYQNNLTKGIYEQKVADFPTAARQCFSSSAAGRLIVGGGAANGGTLQHEVYEYDPNMDAWKLLPSINIPRKDAKCIYAGQRLFVMGGWGYDRSNRLGSVEFIKLDATSQSSQWEVCQTPLPYELSAHDVVAVDDNIYLTGGRENYLTYCTNSRKVYQGNISSEGNDIIWKQLPIMLKRRLGHISFLHKNKLYVAGGPEDFATNTCEYYDPQGDTWVLLSHKLPCDELYGACATFDCAGQVIITGGVYHCGSHSPKAISFDLENGFRYVADFEMTEPRYNHVALHMT